MPSSGTGGPCDHCGRTQSCCWRRGPSNKPVLCNACGSRYLVKKNLDGYRPIEQRAEPVGRVKAKGQRATAPAASTAARKKRTASKRPADAAWSYDSEESTEIGGVAALYLTDDSETPDSSVGIQTSDDTTTGVPDRRSMLGDASRAAKVLRINSEAELRAAGLQLFQPSLRLKPRKPLHPRISVVF